MFTYGITGTTIDEFRDVTLLTVTNGQVLVYDSATSQWKNVSPSALAILLSDLDDVGINPLTLATGQALRYNAVSGKWENTILTLGTDTAGNYVVDVAAGTGVTVSHAQGEGSTATVSIGQAVATTDNVTFAGVTADAVRIGVTSVNEIDTVSGGLTIDSASGTTTVDDNLVVTGDLTVSGSTTTINTETLTVNDNIIVLNNNVTAAPTEDAGIEVERGTSLNVSVRWNEVSDIWEFTNDGTVYRPISSVTNLDSLTDTTVATPLEYQTLEYDGTGWVNTHASVATYVRNADSVTLNVGTVVYLFGATGDHATVKRADNDSDATSSKTVGMVAGASIAPNANGTVITRGYVDGINLSVGYAAGDILWLGEDGGFTKTKPTAPEHLVFVGVVVRATNNGIVYVAVQNGYELDELHNVAIDSGTLADGDVLTYDSGTGLWVNAVSSGGGGALVQSDFVSPYSYIGVAPSGSATSAAVWNITRIEMDTGFPVTTATGVEWDDRLTETYS